MLDEREVRDAAMLYVAGCTSRSGGIITRAELEDFKYEGEPIKLIDQSRGIRNPRQLRATISILTQPNGPYADSAIEAGRLHYAYRTGAAGAGDNRKLRQAADLGLPLILLTGVEPGMFFPTFPVYISRVAGSDTFVEVVLDEGLRYLSDDTDPDRRSYIERLIRQRVHQPLFRAQVISAYGTRCAMCRLHHRTLLDAAHILPDGHPRGRAIVPNGLSLCKIHHAAYDANIVGIRPDLVVDIQPKVLAEVDGPMLLHGLQEMKGVRLTVPRAKQLQPDPDRLEERYEQWRAAS